VIEHSRFDSEGSFLNEGAVKEPPPHHPAGENGLCKGTVLSWSVRRPPLSPSAEGCRIFTPQVPGVTRELSFHSLKKPAAEKMICFSRPDNSKQRVESYEMIHVRVSHKNVGDLEQSLRKGVEIAKIKEHRPPLILKGDEKARS